MQQQVIGSQVPDEIAACVRAVFGRRQFSTAPKEVDGCILPDAGRPKPVKPDQKQTGFARISRERKERKENVTMKPTHLLEPSESTRSNAHQPGLDLSQPARGKEQINKQRRTLIGGALAALLASSGRALADGEDDDSSVSNPFILLLKGVYQPVPHLPNLGLSGVNLADPSYIKTKIYPIFGVLGIPGSQDQDKAIGDFYVSFSNPVCVYDLPGGAIAMQFASGPVYSNVGFNTFVSFPDGASGFYLEGTFELAILDATGIYKPFKGGHNHMVDRLHQLNAAGTKFDEFCFCNISTYQFP
jgi:hypothetical protein